MIDAVTDTIEIQFNGQKLQIPSGCTITQLLELVAMRSHLVAVEVNLEIVPKGQHNSHVVCAGDTIEAVTLVGGG